MNKTCNSSLGSWNHAGGTISKPDLKLYYRAPESRNCTFEKENIMRRAEQEAAKKIEEIERKARLKVM